MPNRINFEIGEDVRDGFLYIGEGENSRAGKRRLIVKCPQCSMAVLSSMSEIRVGRKVSCGCLGRGGKRNPSYRHGLSKSKDYHSYQAAINRCFNKSYHQYYNYGARGIRVSDEFLKDPEKYIKYIRSLDFYRRKGYSLDRIDNEKGYERGNLRWANRSDQKVNQRINILNKSGYTGINITSSNKIRVTLKYKKVTYLNKKSPTIEEALLERNRLIKENNLPHKIQLFRG